MKTYKEFVSEANLGKLLKTAVKVVKKVVKSTGEASPKNTGKTSKV